MDDARPVRLRVRFVLRSRRLETRAGGDVRSPSGVVTRISCGACGNSGNHDFSLSFLFFWQAAEEVEEGRTKGRGLADRKNATAADLRSARADTMVGMFFSNFIMYFIILTTAATLHAHGQTDITTARQAAEALRPLAGNGAYSGRRGP